MTEGIPFAEVAVSDGRIAVSGDLSIGAVDSLDRAAICRDGAEARCIDIAQVSRLDTAGAWLLVDLQRRIGGGDEGRLRIEGATEAHRQLIETVRRNMPPEAAGKPRRTTITDRFEAVGRATVSAGKTATALIGFLGQVVAALGATLLRPRRLRLTSLVHHMQEVGWNAIPIVALMAFLIGVVLPFRARRSCASSGPRSSSLTSSPSRSCASWASC